MGEWTNIMEKNWPPEDSMTMDVEECRKWFKANVSQGGVVFIKHTQGGFTCYCADIVVEVTDRKKFRTENHGLFYSSGKFYYAPTGQTNMVIPTIPIMEAALAGRMWLGSQYADEGMNMLHPSCGHRPKPGTLDLVKPMLERIKEEG